MYTDLQSVASPLGHSTLGGLDPPREWVRPAPSGRRDSNPRPSPWQGDALPTEPRPHALRVILRPVRRGTIAESDGGKSKPSQTVSGGRSRLAGMDAGVHAQTAGSDRRPTRRPYGRSGSTDRRLRRRRDPGQCPYDHGLVVGDGVFEALKVTAAGPFAVRRHLERMTRSARAMELPEPDHALVRHAIEEVSPARLGGRQDPDHLHRREGPLGSQAAYGPPTLVVAAEPTSPPAITTSIVTAPWRRNEHGALTGVKSTSYAENVRGLSYAHAREARRRSSSTRPATSARGPAPTSSASSATGWSRRRSRAGCAGRHHPRAAARVVRHRRAGLHARPRPPGRTRSSSPRRCVTSRRVSRWDEVDYAAPGPAHQPDRCGVPGRRSGEHDRSVIGSAGVRRSRHGIWWSSPCGARGDWRSGSALRSHRRGHWFEPSIAHPYYP